MYTYQQKILMTSYHDFVEEEEAGVDLLQNLVNKYHSIPCVLRNSIKVNNKASYKVSHNASFQNSQVLQGLLVKNYIVGILIACQHNWILSEAGTFFLPFIWFNWPDYFYWSSRKGFKNYLQVIFDMAAQHTIKSHNFIFLPLPTKYSHGKCLNSHQISGLGKHQDHRTAYQSNWTPKFQTARAS